MLLVFVSCQKDFLEKSPIIGITEDNFYRNEDDALAAVNAAYASLQFQLSPSGHFRWFWGDIMSDDAIKGGSGDNDVNELLQLESFTGKSNTTLLESEWGANYEGIYRANVVLEKLPDIVMNEKLKARILGRPIHPILNFTTSLLCLARFPKQITCWHPQNTTYPAPMQKRFGS